MSGTEARAVRSSHPDALHWSPPAGDLTACGSHLNEVLWTAQAGYALRAQQGCPACQQAARKALGRPD